MAMNGTYYPSAPADIKAHVALSLFGPNPPPSHQQSLGRHYLYWNVNTLNNPEVIVIYQAIGLGDDLTAFMLVRVVPMPAMMKLPQERIGEIVESVVMQSYIDLSSIGVDVICTNAGTTVFTKPVMANEDKPFDGTLITTITTAKLGIGTPSVKPPTGKIIAPADVIYTLTTVLVDQLSGINYIPLCIETAVCVNGEWSYVGGYVSEGCKDNAFYQVSFEKARIVMSRLLKVTGLDISEKRGMVPDTSDYFSKYRK